MRIHLQSADVVAIIAVALFCPHAGRAFPDVELARDRAAGADCKCGRHCRRSRFRSNDNLIFSKRFTSRLIQ
ncbi:MAG: hypothetical protein QOJ04_1680 [Caballeronia sp.]|nr:hypothetical protein [Caballeronia sp.]